MPMAEVWPTTSTVSRLAVRELFLPWIMIPFAYPEASLTLTVTSLPEVDIAGRVSCWGHYTIEVSWWIGGISSNSVTIINSNIGAILTSCISSYQQGEKRIAFKPIAPNFISWIEGERIFNSARRSALVFPLCCLMPIPLLYSTRAMGLWILSFCLSQWIISSYHHDICMVQSWWASLRIILYYRAKSETQKLIYI